MKIDTIVLMSLVIIMVVVLILMKTRIDNTQQDIHDLNQLIYNQQEVIEIQQEAIHKMKYIAYLKELKLNNKSRYPLN